MRPRWMLRCLSGEVAMVPAVEGVDVANVGQKEGTRCER